MSTNITPHDFLDDAEKMRDFIELSRDEFLTSYSYLTTEEYELTRKRMLELADANITEGTVTVTVYLDTVYPSDMIETMLNNGYENMIDLDFPVGIVKAFYDCSVGRVAGWDEFGDWLQNEYTCDDTANLYMFAVTHGYVPDAPKLRKYTVEFTSTIEVYATDDKEAVHLAMSQHTLDDGYIYVDGDLWS